MLGVNTTHEVHAWKFNGFAHPAPTLRDKSAALFAIRLDKVAAGK
jgi:hypothetical protein